MAARGKRRKWRDRRIGVERIGRTWRMWRKLYARTLRLVRFGLDHSVPCSSKNRMPLLELRAVR